ncbi:MAG TPA: arabinosyltransferase, partial [Corynebacterium sp.]|nr:arabinosyltransferase [Corynebacterium sp.]
MSTVASEPQIEGKEAPHAPAGWLKNLAIISGLLAFLFFLATPFLPVHQTQSSFSWPQNGSLNSVNAPLISVAPESLAASVPLAALDLLHEDQDTVLSTVPADSPQASDRGLFIRGVAGESLDVISLSEVVFTLDAADLARLDDDAVVEISATGEGVSVAIPGTSLSEQIEDDLRPQVTGVYSEIADTPENLAALTAAGLNVEVEINS